MFKEGQQVYLITPFYSEKVCYVVKGYVVNGYIIKGYIIKAEHPYYFVNFYPLSDHWYSYYDLIECD
jgi:hypothetical protein